MYLTAPVMWCADLFTVFTVLEPLNISQLLLLNRIVEDLLISKKFSKVSVETQNFCNTLEM